MFSCFSFRFALLLLFGFALVCRLGLWCGARLELQYNQPSRFLNEGEEREREGRKGKRDQREKEDASVDLLSLEFSARVRRDAFPSRTEESEMVCFVN